MLAEERASSNALSMMSGECIFLPESFASVINGQTSRSVPSPRRMWTIGGEADGGLDVDNGSRAEIRAADLTPGPRDHQLNLLGYRGVSPMRLSSIAALLFLAFSTPLPSIGLGPAPAEARARTACGADFYINSRGHCVHRPMRAPSAPAGASAKCRDGTYSFSQSRRGTCSWHGGVAQWL